MDDIVAEEQDFSLRELPPSRRFESARDPTVEGVVLLSAVHPDDGPHPVLMRI